MSTPLRVFDGPFGRLMLLEVKAAGAPQALPDPAILLKHDGGNTEYLIGDERLALTREDVLFANPNEAHADVRAAGVAPTRMLVLYASGAWLQRNFPAVFAIGDGHLFPHRREPITPRIRRLADTLAIEALNDQFLSAERLEFMLQELMLSIVDTYLARRRAGSALWRGSRTRASGAPSRSCARTQTRSSTWTSSPTRLACRARASTTCSNCAPDARRAPTSTCCASRRRSPSSRAAESRSPTSRPNWVSRRRATSRDSSCTKSEFRPPNTGARCGGPRRSRSSRPPRASPGQNPTTDGWRGHLRRRAWRLVGGLGVEEDASPHACPRPSLGDAHVHRPRRARASRASGDRPRGPHRGHAGRAALRGFERRDSRRPQLRRHGGDRRRRARRGPPGAARLLGCLRSARRRGALRPRVARGAHRNAQGRRRAGRGLAHPAQSDSPRHRPRRRRMDHAAPHGATEKDLRAKAAPFGRGRAPGAHLHLLPSPIARRRVPPVRRAHAQRGRLARARDRRQPQPANHRARAARRSALRANKLTDSCTAKRSRCASPRPGRP